MWICSINIANKKLKFTPHKIIIIILLLLYCIHACVEGFSTLVEASARWQLCCEADIRVYTLPMPLSAEEPCLSDEVLRTVIYGELWSVPHLVMRWCGHWEWVNCVIGCTVPMASSVPCWQLGHPVVSQVLHHPRLARPSPPVPIVVCLARQPLPSALLLLRNRDCAIAVMWRVGTGTQDCMYIGRGAKYVLGSRGLAH